MIFTWIWSMQKKGHMAQGTGGWFPADLLMPWIRQPACVSPARPKMREVHPLPAAADCAAKGGWPAGWEGRSGCLNGLGGDQTWPKTFVLYPVQKFSLPFAPLTSLGRCKSSFLFFTNQLKRWQRAATSWFDFRKSNAWQKSEAISDIEERQQVPML